MIELIQGIDTSRILSWLEKDIAPRLTPDKSNYAKNRMRAWLRTEPPLGNTQPFRPGIPMSDPMWARLQEIVSWKFDYCLVTYSGMTEAIGITPHRDASYADWEALGLNVSGTCRFSYWNDRLSFGRGPSSETCPFPGNPSNVIDLVPGDLVRFNCKNVHSAEPSANRWNMNFWKKKG